MKLLRWILLLPGVFTAWVAALIIGVGYTNLLSYLCQPGRCRADWLFPAYNFGMAAGPGLAAGLMVLSAILIAPTHRLQVGIITYVVVAVVAMCFAYLSGFWAGGVATLSVGLIVLLLSWRNLHSQITKSPNQ